MQNESVTLKVTPAGKAFLKFIHAFNSGDVKTIVQFIEDNYAQDTLQQHPPEDIAAWYMEVYKYTGGLEIYKVYLSQEHYIIVLTSAKGDGALYMDKLKVTPEAPHKIIQYFHEAAPQV